ncbi:MAG: radical SAM protein, partial [Promethearchaeota archaeon]
MIACSEKVLIGGFEKMTRRAKSIARLEFAHYKQKPSHPDFNMFQKEALQMAIKILKRINWGNGLIHRIRQQKRNVIGLSKTIKNFFHNKIKMAKGDHDFIPLFYIWTMTNACNFTCTYCSNHRGGRYPDLYKKGLKKNLTTEQGKELIRVMRKSSTIYFCGGEPTLRKDLPELLRYSTKLRMFNMINTNGSLIGNLLLKPEYRDFLLQMDVVIISLDSLNVNRLANLYNVNESLAKTVLRNILILNILRKYVPFKLTANTVISRDNLEDCFDVLDWCNDLRITYSPVAMNIGNQVDHKLIKDPKYEDLVRRILERAKAGYPMISSPKMLERLLHARIKNCYPTVFDHIDNDGCVYWPCKS